MRVTIKNTAIFFFLLFIASYFLPYYSNGDDNLLGFKIWIFNLLGFAFVNSLSNYIIFLFENLTVLWVLLLFIQIFKNDSKLMLIIALAILAITSSCLWYFQIDDTKGILYGYWIWIVSIIGVSACSLLNARSKQKKNTATE